MAAIVERFAAPRSTAIRQAAWSRLRWVPLAVILSVQTSLALRTLARTPSLDEARYIYAGHQLIYELWHGGGSPYYDTYFSGAPDIYCPLAAMADHVGGLTAVRLMSLCFMLSATTLLFATTRHLFGYRAGCAAAGLLATTGLTSFVGTYANYDAMALMFMAAAAYCAVRSSETKWLLAVPTFLLLANATKYMTLLFDPVIIGMAALQPPGRPWRHVAKRLAGLAATVAALVGLAAILAGGAYIKGVMFTTLARKKGASVLLSANYRPLTFIITESWRWVGVVVALSMLALLVGALDRGRPARLRLLSITVIAGLLVTLEAVHLHTDESMIQHDDYSAWFACIAAGYVLSVLSDLITKRRIVHMAAYAAVTSAAIVIVVNPELRHPVVNPTQVSSWRTSVTAQMEAIVRPYIRLSHAKFLISGGSAFHMFYMDHVDVPWFNFTDDNYFKYPIPGRGGDSHGQTPGIACTTLHRGCMYLEGPVAYRAAIRAHWFAVISLSTRHSTSLPADTVIEQTVEHTFGYALLTRVGGAPTWIYAPDYRHLPATAHKTKATAQPATAHHEPRALTVLRTLAVILAPSAVYLAALLLLLGAVAWQRRRRRLEAHPDSRMATRVPARGTAAPAGYPVAGRDPRPARSARGARGPIPPNREKALRARAVLPLASPRLVVVMGSTVGAGQTVTTLMLADMLASLRGEPVAALDLNPGPASLRELARIPAATASTVLAGRLPSAHPAHLGQAGHPARPGGPKRGSRGRGHLDVICQDSAAMAGGTLTGLQHNRLIGILASRYLLTLADPAASEVAEILAAADQLVLVVPASADAAEAVSMIGEWLGEHGHSALAAHSIAVINGVSQRSVRHAERVELVLRGRCRAIVRVPWDDHLAEPATGRGIRDNLQAPGRPSRLGRLPPPVLQAYTALAGALVSALAVGPACCHLDPHDCGHCPAARRRATITA